MKIHIWVPELVAIKGGIQVFSRHLLQALQLVVGVENMRVFSKSDTKPPEDGDFQLDFRCFGSRPASLRTLLFAAGVIREGLRDRPDLVITTHLNFAVAAHWLKKLIGTPYWCVAHGIEAWGLTRRDRISGLRGADRIFAVSNYTRDRLLSEQTLNPDLVSILPNTFSADAFQPGPKPEYLLRRHALGSQKKIILTVGRLVEAERYKGYDCITRVLSKVRESVSEVHYILVGRGPDQGRIQKLVTALGLADCVTLTGYVSDEELVDYYNLCDVFAMPSKGEGFGIVYLEALACGKPVLAGSGDGSSDPLQKGKLGVLVDPDDDPKVANALIEILNGSYPLPILYRPEELRARVISAFGFQRFSAVLAGHLNDFAVSRGLESSLPTGHQRRQVTS